MAGGVGGTQPQNAAQSRSSLAGHPRNPEAKSESCAQVINKAKSIARTTRESIARERRGEIYLTSYSQTGNPVPKNGIYTTSYNICHVKSPQVRAMKPEKPGCCQAAPIPSPQTLLIPGVRFTWRKRDQTQPPRLPNPEPLTHPPARSAADVAAVAGAAKPLGLS